MFNRKPYRTKAQKAEARRTARQDADGAWRSEAPFSIHGEAGEWYWDASHKVPVRKSGDAGSIGAGAGLRDRRTKRTAGG
jgi:hypothetical protein